MPEENKDMVDLDTSGPEVEVALPQEKEEGKDETGLKDGGITVDTSPEPAEQSDVQTEEQKPSEDVQAATEDASDKRQDNSKEVEEYSELTIAISAVTGSSTEWWPIITCGIQSLGTILFAPGR